MYDRNYLSTYDQIRYQFSLKTDSEFTNITLNEVTPIFGKPFNISSSLVSEFEETLANKLVSCQYFNNGTWIEISSNYTDTVGKINFQIDIYDPIFDPSMITSTNESRGFSTFSSACSVPFHYIRGVGL